MEKLDDPDARVPVEESLAHLQEDFDGLLDAAFEADLFISKSEGKWKLEPHDDTDEE